MSRWRWCGVPSSALQLAAHFADSDDGQDAKKDGFFDPAREELLAMLLLAAALSDRPISQVWEWLTNESNTEPARVLDLAGHHLASKGLFGEYNSDPKQRSGVFGTARKMARILRSPELRPWIEHGGDRRRFDHRAFAASDSATLYLLSMEGAGSAGPAGRTDRREPLRRGCYRRPETGSELLSGALGVPAQ